MPKFEGTAVSCCNLGVLWVRLKADTISSCTEELWTELVSVHPEIKDFRMELSAVSVQPSVYLVDLKCFC